MFELLDFSYVLLFTHAEAMDRIHRLGQHRPVEAIKLVIEDSIESRIVQVRHRIFFNLVVRKCSETNYYLTFA